MVWIWFPTLLMIVIAGVWIQRTCNVDISQESLDLKGIENDLGLYYKTRSGNKEESPKTKLSYA